MPAPTKPLAAALALVAGAALAGQGGGVGVVYSTGGKFDASFNQSAFEGATRWSAKSGAAVREFEPQGVSQMSQALRRFAAEGLDPVIAIGFLQAGALAEVAPDFPGTRFAIIDAVVDAPNVMSVVFREEQEAYVVGALAAAASEAGHIGMVGGMDIPLIRKIACGYRLGAHSVDPGAVVTVAYAGDTPAAFADPARGAELALGQIEAGADVILQAAGGTGIGVLQAVADSGVLGIGSDSNQNGLHPGHVLTSFLKRTDVAVERAIERWRPGLVALGLAENGMDWVIDDHNAALLTEDIKAVADTASTAIATGLLTVHDITKDGPCPTQ